MAIVFAMSSGCPKRLKTVRDLNRSYIGLFAAAALPASDSMMPGAIALAVMLWRPPSSAAVFARPKRPGFGEGELGWPKPPSVPANQGMKIHPPPFFFAHYGPTPFVQLEVPGRVTPSS